MDLNEKKEKTHHKKLILKDGNFIENKLDDNYYKEHDNYPHKFSGKKN